MTGIRITELEAENAALKSQVAYLLDPWAWGHDRLAVFGREYDRYDEKHGYYESIVYALKSVFKLFNNLPAEARARDERLIEKLAAIEHDQWVHWAKSILETETISTARAERWKGLFVPYSDLTEEQKEQDRVWARKVLQAEREAADET